jgi:hypothetical protein
MNAPEKDQSLRPALLAWQVAPPVDPGFRSAVWAGIEAARERFEITWSGYLRRHIVAWVLVLGMAAVGAGWVGHSAGADHALADRDLVLTSYVAAIDARAMEP